MNSVTDEISLPRLEAAEVTNWSEYLNGNLDELLKAECGHSWEGETSEAQVLGDLPHPCGFYDQKPTNFSP